MGQSMNHRWLGLACHYDARAAMRLQVFGDRAHKFRLLGIEPTGGSCARDLRRDSARHGFYVRRAHRQTMIGFPASIAKSAFDHVQAVQITARYFFAPPELQRVL